ncbi:MAG TPA: hypothetical protein VNS46_00785 [Nocardioides sp.]|nr:hypothetical protein [Nocardioides sp.]
MPESRNLAARRAIEFLSSSELVNMEMPVSRLADSVSKLEEVAGYVLAWEKYVLVVGDVAEQIENPVIR